MNVVKSKAEPQDTTGTICPCCGHQFESATAIRGVDRMLGTPGEFDVRICGSCKTGMTLPLVDEAKLADFYAGEYISTADWNPNPLVKSISRMIHAFSRWRLLRSKPLSVLRERSGKLLDVGCGRGELGSVLIERGWEVTGIEPSEGGSSVARSVGMTVERGTLATTSLPTASFDVVNFRHSLEHVVDPSADIAVAVSLASPGGMVIVEVPNFGCWQRRAFGSRWFHLDLPRHRTHFSESGLRNLLEAHGLTVRSSGTKSSSNGLGGSIQYAVFGHWAATGAISTRVVAGMCSMLAPVGRFADVVMRGGDFLYAIAEKSK